MKKVLTVMEVVESWNTENKTPSNVKITLHGEKVMTEIGEVRIRYIINPYDVCTMLRSIDLDLLLDLSLVLVRS